MSEYDKIPYWVHQSIKEYVNDHILLPHFLHAVFSNDLINVIAYGDEESLKMLPTYVRYMVNILPADCYGSHEKVEKWLQTNKK